ncbi:MAG: hypothetical protein IPK39_14740 [Sulfuritalea sp.]|nr:hypothetical protein [Sulfuritalea sp.]
MNGNYDLASAGKLSIEIFGNTFDLSTKQYDRLEVNGTVKLNGDSNPAGGGALDVHLGYGPSVGPSSRFSATMASIRSAVVSRGCLRVRPSMWPTAARP